MKKLILTVSLMLSSPAFALSDCANGEQNCWDCGKTESDLCTARKTGNELKITGTGEMRNYGWTTEVSGPYGQGEPLIPWGYDYTSVSIEGVQNVGNYAFTYAQITTAQIADSVKTIGYGSFNSCHNLQNFVLPESVTSLGGGSFAWTPYRNNDSEVSLTIPASVTSIGNHAFRSANISHLIIEGTPTLADNAFEYIGTGWGGYRGTVDIYCPAGIDCTGKGQDTNYVSITEYTKSDDGVYSVTKNGVTTYFSSPENMADGISCNHLTDECQTQAAAYQMAKAQSMAGGALCQDTASCLTLLNMANSGQDCASVASCHDWLSRHVINPDGSITIYEDGKIVGFKNKRIYTVEEAKQAVEAAGTDTVRFRISYK